MPKLKQPKTLRNLAIETLGIIIHRIRQKAMDAIGSGRTAEINTGDLRQYLYGDLPYTLSCGVTRHMLSLVRLTKRNKTYQEFRNTDEKIVMESIILACVYPQITVLDMSRLPIFALRILCSNIHTFQKLQTLRFSLYLPIDVVETLPIGLSFLKYLVKFIMQFKCTDAIIQTLGSCCSTTIEHIDVRYSKKITDASFKIFMKCHKLKYLSICDTSMTAEGYVQFCQNIRQHQSDDIAKGFLHLSVGSDIGWEISTTQLKEIANTCPMLKKLEMSVLLDDLEELVSLTTLEELEIRECDFYKCNLNGFLRVRGSNLISLDLEGSYPIDLTCIMNHCINIKELYVTGCIINSALGNLENTEKACQSLEILQISCEFSPSSIEGMLYACVNVTRLLLAPYYEDITDEFILLLLSNNPFQKITSFIAASPVLTMTSVNAIIQHCPLLKMLEYQDHCHAITNKKVKILRKKVKNRNLNLRVYFSSEIPI